ncbi:hemolysin family protein [Phytomonospora endophytica]|uniref:CBS domain containing-hemolysin-like protein n=1 Tax=Phytomonospora endophytica TaxID=714109 RepID=A0A841FCT0_9ACTN|nr:hemolysin family protein [Phytomonospora endophytica]MBB6034076.1 CBS domain containing-hemolysin-like protein [Phytomonospora endophytica]GIG66470.1 membrane protein [Phytomonospora endophytica]
MSTPTLLGVAVALVVLAGLSAMTDAALSRISPARAAELARDGVRGATGLQAIAEDRPRYINLLLLLRLACELTATTLVALTTFDAWGIGWAATLTTAGSMLVVSYVVIGVGPRTIGVQHAYPVALASSAIVRFLGRAFGPLTRLLILVGNAVTPGKGFREGPFATETELRELVDIAEQRGEVEHGERQMIHSVFQLGDTIVREVMVPRTEMVWIEADKTAAQARALALRSGFSRIPVVGEDIDDIRGVVYLKDLIRLPVGGDDAKVGDIMREATFVPESKPVDDLLREMQSARVHIAVVVDEYGGTAGLVTIEDILEEIVGEITDEYDVERAPVQRLADGSVRVTARLSVEDLGELFGLTLPEENVETVSGLLAQALGKVPIPGAEAVVEGLRLTAEGTTGRRNRIDTVLVRREPAEDADDKAEKRMGADA